MTDLTGIKALAFDVFGTVVDWRGGIAHEAARLLGQGNGGLDRDWAAFASAWRARYQPAMSKVRDGEMPFTKLDVLHRMNLLEVLDEFEVTGLGEAEIDDLNFAWHRLDPWPDVVEGLTRLKRKYILATLSNGNVALMVNMAKRAGLPWDVVLGAEVVRHYKPMPAAYRLSVEMLGLPPAAVMMVAAHNNDLIAARAEGMATAFVPRPTEYGPGQTTDLAATENFDVIATDFVDMAQQLGA